MLRRQTLVSVVGAICCMASFMLPALANDAGNLIVHVTGLKNNVGSVRIALFNSENSYSNDKFTGELAFRKEILPIKNNSADYTFEKLPYGDYAIKLFHDEDSSGKFETGMFGIPKVQYGFSNNARGKFGPAGYDKAVFHMNSAEQKMQIDMQ